MPLTPNALRFKIRSTLFWGHQQSMPIISSIPYAPIVKPDRPYSSKSKPRYNPCRGFDASIFTINRSQLSCEDRIHHKKFFSSGQMDMLDQSSRYKRVRAGIIPYAVDDYGEILFLLGKEIYGKWSPLAGTVESDENLPEAATREFIEESMGLFNHQEVMDYLDPSRNLICLDKGVLSHYYVVPTRWDPHLPIYFQNITKFFLRCTKGRKNQWNVPTIGSCPDAGLFEKSHLSWFSLTELKDMPDRDQKDIFNSKGIHAVQSLLKLDWLEVSLSKIP